MTAPSKKANDRDEDEEAVVEVIQKEEDQGWRRCGRSPAVCFRCRGRRRCEETFLPAHQHLAGLFVGIWECPTSGGDEQCHLAGGEEFGRRMRSGEGRKEAKESSGIATAPSKKADDRDEDEEAVVEVIQKEEDQGWRRCGRSSAVCLRCRGKRRCEETFLPTHQHLVGLFVGIWECPASGGGEQRHLTGGEEFGRRMRSGEDWKEGKESSGITTAPSKKADDRDEDEEAVVEVIQKEEDQGWRQCGRSPAVCLRCRGRRRCEETFLPAHQHHPFTTGILHSFTRTSISHLCIVQRCHCPSMIIEVSSLCNAYRFHHAMPTDIIMPCQHHAMPTNIIMPCQLNACTVSGEACWTVTSYLGINLCDIML